MPTVKAAAPPTHLTVVVVEDDETLRALFAAVLVRRGHTVVTAATLRDACDVCATQRPDVVALDMMMPRGSGAELIAALRATTRPPRIIAMSGDATALDAALAAGADVTLNKPFTFNEFLAAIEATA